MSPEVARFLGKLLESQNIPISDPNFVDTALIASKALMELRAVLEDHEEIDLEPPGNGS